MSSCNLHSHPLHKKVISIPPCVKLGQHFRLDFKGDLQLLIDLQGESKTTEDLRVFSCNHTAESGVVFCYRTKDLD